MNIVLIQWGNVQHLLQNNNVWGNLAQHLDKVVFKYQIFNSTDKIKYIRAKSTTVQIIIWEF